MFQRRLAAGRALATRALRVRTIADLVAGVVAVETAGAGLLAAALAYQAAFGLLAGLVFASGLIGFLFDDPARREAAVAAISNIVPGLETVARGGLTTLASGRGALSVLGLLGSIWGASSFYDVLDDAIARAMPGGRVRGPLHRRRRGIMATLVLTFTGLLALVMSLTLSATMTAATGTLPALAIGAAELGLGLGLMTIGLVAIYRFVPVKPSSLRDAALPAFVAAVVIRIAAVVFGALAPLLVANLQVFGVVVSLLALLVWLAWAFRILLFGAAWAAVRRDRASGLDSPAT